MNGGIFLSLSEADVERLLPIRECMDWVGEALAEYSSGLAAAPPRLRLLVPEGRTSFMPCYLPSRDSLTCKIASFFGKNIDRGLPSVISSIAVLDPHTGILKCIMGGTFLTAVRTGAIAGIAVKYLARKKQGTVGVLGSGLMARWGFIYLAMTMTVERALVYSRSPVNRETYARDLQMTTGAPVEACPDPDTVVAQADVLLCATSSRTPALDGGFLRPGSMVISLGANTPDTREIDATTVRQAKIIVDSRESALKECGEFILPIRDGLLSPDQISGEIGQIIAGDVPLHLRDGEIVLMKSVGISAVDAMVASHIYERAQQASS